MTTPLLDTIHNPADLRRLHEKQLRQVADELRAETINAVAVTGGHLGAGRSRSFGRRSAARTAQRAGICLAEWLDGNGERRLRRFGVAYSCNVSEGAERGGSSDSEAA